MKKNMLLMLCNFALLSQGFAQDLILSEKGELFECKIVETNDKLVRYTFKQTPNVIYSLKKEEVSKIYINKTLAQFKEDQNPTKTKVDSSVVGFEPSTNYYRPQNQPSNPKIVTSTNSPTKVSPLYLQGVTDAHIYYQGYKGAGTGTFVTTVLFGGIGGLVTAVACSETRPRESNLGYPNSELMNDAEYSRGYLDTAHKKKRKKVWTNFGSGFGTLLLLLLLL